VIEIVAILQNYLILTTIFFIVLDFVYICIENGTEKTELQL